MTDAECYEKLYGNLIQYVPFYMGIKIDIRPGAINNIPKHQRKYMAFVDEYRNIIKEL